MAPALMPRLLMSASPNCRDCTMHKKTDNHNLPAKLALRRHFLRKYHQGTALDPNAPAGAKSGSPGTARPGSTGSRCCGTANIR